MEVLRLLVKNGADVRFKDSTGRAASDSALYLAVQGGHEELAHLLLKCRSINTNSKDNAGLSPLIMAAGAGHESAVYLLLQQGADVTTTTDGSGKTALFLVTESEYVAVVRILLQHGAKISIEDHAGQIPLKVAEAKGYTNITNLFGICAPVKSTDDIKRLLKSDAHQEEVPLAVEGARQTIVGEAQKWLDEALQQQRSTSPTVASESLTQALMHLVHRLDDASMQVDLNIKYLL